METPMIFGIGTDIIEIGRVQRAVEKWGASFTDRVFCPGEIEYALGKGSFYYATLAGRFAAKEAVLKSIGTGLAGGRWRDIEISVEPRTSRPVVVLKGEVLRKADEQQVARIYISISHCREYAVAFSTAERG